MESQSSLHIEANRPARAPNLPPRNSTTSPISADPSSEAPPPAYDDVVAQQSAALSKAYLGAEDPRSSSTQSLVPADSNQQHERQSDGHTHSRRKLLLIYIHGFMGNETSFRSFPAHVHNLVTVLLSETHVVHTKIYPRYRSKRNISFARDDFSQWLEPHEGRDVDVILLGHSMGGLLSAEVVLMPPSEGRGLLKHRLLGSINFDVPFLGMHPGVVKSGLASIFVGGGEKEPGDKYDDSGHVMDGNNNSSASLGESASRPNRTDTLWTPDQQDPNYNPTFQNDVILPVRKGWRNAWHFVNKHASSASDLGKATKQLVTSHLEFGGAMANYSELKLRYGRVRGLEEESETIRRSVIRNAGPARIVPPRVRFVNYYTASTGRVKKKSPERETTPESTENIADLQTDGPSRGSTSSRSPRISLEEHRDGAIVQKNLSQPMQDLPPTPYEGEYEDWDLAAESITVGETSSAGQSSRSGSLKDNVSSSISLSIPDLPSKPPDLDLSFISDENTRKLVSKEHERAVKAYEKAVKDREKAKNSAKMEENQDRQVKKEAQKARRDAEKAYLKLEKEKRKAEKKAQREKPESEMTHSEKEARRLKQEKLRMENEGRRMRGELPLPNLPDETILEDESTSTDEVLSEDGNSSMTSSRPSVPVSVSRQMSEQTLDKPSPSHSSLAPTKSRSSQKTEGKSRTKEASKEKKKKEGKFCTLPPKDSQGERDPCWVRVHMENVDEVGAHCGLFFVDERYERLVGDVAERIEEWVKEDCSRRVAAGESEYGANDMENYRRDVKR